MAGSGIQDGRYRVVVGIRIAIQHARSRHVQGCVLVRAVAVVVGHRRIVDAQHVDADGGDIRAGLAVVGIVREAVQTAKVSVRRVAEGAVIAEDE